MFDPKPDLLGPWGFVCGTFEVLGGGPGHSRILQSAAWIANWVQDLMFVRFFVDCWGRPWGSPSINQCEAGGSAKPSAVRYSALLIPGQDYGFR